MPPHSSGKHAYKLSANPWVLFGIVLFFILMSQSWSNVLDSFAVNVWNAGKPLTLLGTFIFAAIITTAFIVTLKYSGVSLLKFEKESL